MLSVIFESECMADLGGDVERILAVVRAAQEAFAVCLSEWRYEPHKEN